MTKTFAVMCLLALNTLATKLEMKDNQLSNDVDLDKKPELAQKRLTLA